MGDLVFTNIYDEVGDGHGGAGPGRPTAVDWHAAVDGINNTISIYDVYLIEDYQDRAPQHLLGGYRKSAWASGPGMYTEDLDAFIFNLTTNIMQDQANNHWGSDYYSVIDKGDLFPTFGGGHDLYGGVNYLGSGSLTGGLSYGATSEGVRGPNDLIGGTNKKLFVINGLETYTLTKQSVSPVPAPAAIWLFGIGMIGLIGFTKQKRAHE